MKLVIGAEAVLLNQMKFLGEERVDLVKVKITENIETVALVRRTDLVSK